MQTCPECGNRALVARVVAGVTVRECGLCGERVGGRRVIDDIRSQEEADRRGILYELWPLVVAIEDNLGLAVEAASPPGVAPRDGDLFLAMPAKTPGTARQMENLLRSIRLAGASLAHEWVVELRYERHLLYVLRPRRRGAPVDLRQAGIDATALAAQLDRNARLSWWHRGE